MLDIDELKYDFDESFMRIIKTYHTKIDKGIIFIII